MRSFFKNIYINAERIIKIIYWTGLNILYKYRFLKPHDIPVIINNYNRLTFPLQLIAFLEKCGMKNTTLNYTNN